MFRLRAVYLSQQQVCRLVVLLLTLGLAASAAQVPAWLFIRRPKATAASRKPSSSSESVTQISAVLRSPRTGGWICEHSSSRSRMTARQD